MRHGIIGALCGSLAIFRACLITSESCLQETGSIWEQFPMVCPVTGEIGKGLPAKVTLHRGYLRVGAGHHHIVEPELAKAYFSKHCWGAQCEIVMKQYKQRSTVDLYHKTPYHR